MDPTDPPSQLTSLGAPGSRRRRLLFFAVSGSFVLAVLFLFREVLTPFALALVVAYVLAPLAAALQRIPFGTRRMPRWVAVVLIMLGLLGTLGTGIAFGAPRLAAEVQRMAGEAPRMIHTVQEEWLPGIESALRDAQRLYAPEGGEAEVVEAPPEVDEGSIRIVPHAAGGYAIRLPDRGIDVSRRGEDGFRITVAESRAMAGRRDLSAMLSQTIERVFADTEAYAGTAFRGVQTFVGKLVGGIFSFFIMLMLSAYLLITSDRIFDFFRTLARPEDRSRFDELVARIDKGLAGVVRGQLLIALVNGVLSGIGFWMADLRYWPVLTLVATVLSIIPIFGAILSSVPAVIVGLQNGIGTALFVLVWIIGIHQIEANLLNPKIMGDAAKVHPVLVVFALLAGEHLFGILGALLAVPILSITQSLFLHFREIALGVPRDPALAREWADATLDRSADDSEEE